SISATDTLASLGVTDGTLEIVSSDSDGNTVTTNIPYIAATTTVGDLINTINGNTANGATSSLRPVSSGGSPRLNIENVGNGSITLNEIGGGNILEALGLTKIPN